MRMMISGYLAITLSGCATSNLGYPSLTAPPYAAQVPPTPLDVVLSRAATSQSSYASSYKAAAREADLLQLPIIGAASLAAALLFNNGRGATNYVAAVGLGVAGYSAFRSTLMPQRLPEIYLAGFAALDCIRAREGTFSGAAASAGRAAYEAKMRQLADALTTGKMLAKSVPSSKATAAQRAAIQDAFSQLTAAVAVGEQVERTGYQQLAAFDGAAQVFGLAASRVEYKVAVAARSGRASNFADARLAVTQAMTSAGSEPPPEALGAPAPLNELGDDAIASALIGQTLAITSLTTAMNATAPNYANSLSEVAACPDATTF